MFTLTVENKYGQQLEITNNESYVIKNIDGIDPPDAVINTTRNAGADGSVFNSAYVDNRVIIIAIAINSPAEENRINLYKYFKPKSPIKLYYKNETRNVYIDGYVQKMPVSFFDKKQVATITIFCPEPYFKSRRNNITDFSSVEAEFEFPFECEVPDNEIEFGRIVIEEEKNIYNGGDVETGCRFILEARGAVENPVIFNTVTNEYFRLNITMIRGDQIIINTVKKQKAVKLISNGVTTNIVGNVASGSTWLQLAAGDNLYMLSAATNPENLDAYCLLDYQYEGV